MFSNSWCFNFGISSLVSLIWSFTVSAFFSFLPKGNAFSFCSLSIIASCATFFLSLATLFSIFFTIFDSSCSSLPISASLFLSSDFASLSETKSWGICWIFILESSFSVISFWGTLSTFALLMSSLEGISLRSSFTTSGEEMSFTISCGISSYSCCSTGIVSSSSISIGSTTSWTGVFAFFFLSFLLVSSFLTLDSSFSVFINLDNFMLLNCSSSVSLGMFSNSWCFNFGISSLVSLIWSFTVSAFFSFLPKGNAFSFLSLSIIASCATFLLSLSTLFSIFFTIFDSSCSSFPKSASSFLSSDFVSSTETTSWLCWISLIEDISVSWVWSNMSCVGVMMPPLLEISSDLGTLFLIFFLGKFDSISGSMTASSCSFLSIFISCWITRLSASILSSLLSAGFGITVDFISSSETTSWDIFELSLIDDFFFRESTTSVSWVWINMSSSGGVILEVSLDLGTVFLSFFFNTFDLISVSATVSCNSSCSLSSFFSKFVSCWIMRTSVSSLLWSSFVSFICDFTVSSSFTFFCCKSLLPSVFWMSSFVCLSKSGLWSFALSSTGV